jgi:hypothetical protein
MDPPIAFPADSISITQQGNVELSFVTTYSFAVRSGVNTCSVDPELESFEGECIQGFASFTVVVYFNETFELAECEACNVDDLLEMEGDDEFCSYLLEIPCEPVS